MTAFAARASGLDMGAVDPYVIAAVAAAVLMAVVWVLARGGRRDPLHDLARWCEAHGLRYMDDAGPLTVARFDGSVDGVAITVEVYRVPARALSDLPPTMTRIASRVSMATGPVLVQPAEWVMTVDGGALPPQQAIGSTEFAAMWAVYADPADEARRAVSPWVQRRLVEDDAAGLALEWTAGAIATTQPGVIADAGERERRLAVLVDMSRLVSAAGEGPAR